MKNLTASLQTIIADGLALLFPPRCLTCQRWGWAFCPHCAQRVEPVGLQICWQCGRPQTNSLQQCLVCQQNDQGQHARPVMIRVAALHVAPLSQAIYGLKYRGQAELAPILARYLFAALLDVPWAKTYRTVDCIVPVPLHIDRLHERGYNQADLLAQALGTQMGLPINASWLTRQRATRSQIGLTAVERHTNVARAFAATPSVRGKRIIILDDVYTTGATLHACANALYLAGAMAVYGLALACPIQKQLGIAVT